MILSDADSYSHWWWRRIFYISRELTFKLPVPFKVMVLPGELAFPR